MSNTGVLAKTSVVYDWLDADELRASFPGFALPPRVAPRYNIAPTQPVLAVPNDGRSQIGFYVWGIDSVVVKGHGDGRADDQRPR
jgi:putative SOS response-associated peptidase YedK